MTDLTFTLRLLACVLGGIVAMGLLGAGLIAAAIWWIDRHNSKREE